jgi:peptide/nickel transport system permease protein
MKGLLRFFSHIPNLLAVAIIVLYTLVAIAAPRLAPPQNPENPAPFKVATVDTATSRLIPLPPQPGLLLGTTPGRLDVFYTLVWGTRSALRFGLTVALTTACVGISIGAVSAYIGGPVNRLTLRITDAFLTFPVIAGAAMFRLVLYPVDQQVSITPLQSLLTSLEIEPVMLTLILFSWMPYVRIVNAEIAKLKQVAYVQAARSIGAGHLRLILRHLLPNAISPAIVLIGRDIGSMVILQAAFTFIGIGEGSPWGYLLAVGRDWIIGPGASLVQYWWVYLPVTLALIFFGIGWNLLADGLNNALNPRKPHQRLW